MKRKKPHIPTFRPERRHGYNLGVKPASYDKSVASGLGIAMQHSIKMCSAVLAMWFSQAASPAISQEVSAPPTAVKAAVDLDELARRAEVIMALVREHHIDPPVPAEMWLAGTRALQQSLAVVELAQQLVRKRVKSRAVVNEPVDVAARELASRLDAATESAKP